MQIDRRGRRASGSCREEADLGSGSGTGRVTGRRVAEKHPVVVAREGGGRSASRASTRGLLIVGGPDHILRVE